VIETTVPYCRGEEHCFYFAGCHPPVPPIGRPEADRGLREVTGWLGQVFVCDAGERGTLALSPDFTDRGGDAAGSALLYLRVLAELARVLAALERR